MGERLTDTSDIATEQEERFRAEALRQVLLASAPQTHEDFDGKTCLECADDIRPERLAMGKIRCTDCQEILERPSRLFGRG